MAEHGGYRAPGNPAPVSGPGQLAKRTDGGPAQPVRVPTGGSYGSASALRAVEQGAAMSSTPGPSATTRQRTPAGSGPSVTPFGAPTQRPNEPVTAGAVLGPGPGPEALGLTAPAASGYQTALQTLQAVAATSNSTEVDALLNQFQARN